MATNLKNSAVATGLEEVSLITNRWGNNGNAKSLQSYLTLCDPRDGSPPGSPIPGVLQARTLERVAISFSNAWKWKVKVKSFSHVWPSVTSDPQRPHGLQPTRLLRPWDFPGRSTGVGCHCLLWCISIGKNNYLTVLKLVWNNSLQTDNGGNV